MSLSFDLRLLIKTRRGDLRFLEREGLTIRKDGVFYAGRIIEVDSEKPPEQLHVRMLVFEAEPYFRIGEVVGLFGGNIDLGTAEVLGFERHNG